MGAMTLRCYAWGREGDWEAICVDLDIAVQGESFDDVYRSLNVAVRDYIATTTEFSPEVRERLLGRRTPSWLRFWIQFKFWFKLLFRSLFGPDHEGNGSFPINTAQV